MTADLIFSALAVAGCALLIAAGAHAWQQFVSTKKQEVSVSAGTPFPKKASTDIIGGPYQPEEVRIIILALGQIEDLLDKKGDQAFRDIQLAAHDWAAQLVRMGPDAYVDKLIKIENEFIEVQDSLMGIIDENRRFHDEIVPAVLDDRGTYGILRNDFSDIIGNIKELSKTPEINIRAVVGRDFLRLATALNAYRQWLSKSIQNIREKTRKLRDFRA